MARKLQWPFFDLDQIMEKEAGKRIHDIVAKETWLGFREREYQICKRFSQMSCSVIALGGGTVRYQWNMDVLRGSGVVILLKANLKVLADRVKKHDRPRVNPGTSLEKDISILWKKYKSLYYEAADLVIKTDRGKTVLEEATEIIRRLEKQGFFKKGRQGQASKLNKTR
jgi:shikimate kinase